MQFAHTLPLAPTRLAPAAKPSPPWTSGRAIAKGPDAVWVVDQDNGQVVRLDPDTLQVLGATAVGPRPEQIAVGPTGDAWVTVRDSRQLVHLGPDGALLGALDLAGEPWGWP